MQALEINGVRIPAFLYGTAWKEDRTKQLTVQAIQNGFRGIDTANQRKHYFEAAVGNALAEVIGKKQITREELFIQTKFTYQRGQDHRLPYDPKAPLPIQVQQSFSKSLLHLQTDYIDSYVLHGPSVWHIGLTQDDLDVWQQMTELYREGKTRLLGVSNFSAQQLGLLLQNVSQRPHFIQNRCYASKGWDKEVRLLCAANGIIYQGFSLLTANRQELKSDKLALLAKKFDKTVPQIIFRFCLQKGMLPLTGTTSVQHMQQDLAVFDFELDQVEMNLIEQLSAA